MALDTKVDSHLKQIFGAAAYAVSGSQATMTTASISADKLQQLLDVGRATSHSVSLVAGVVTIKPV